MVEVVVLLGASILIGLLGVRLGMLLAPRIERLVERPESAEPGSEASEEPRDRDV